MDPVGSGWPYAYNRLVAATAASGSSTGNFSHLTASGGNTTTHHTGGSTNALIVQPTATVAGNPYGGASFLAPPTVGYDVFSTLFHPHAAAAAQVSSQAAANLKSLNYGTAIDVTQGRGVVLLNAHGQQQEASNSSSPSSTSSSSSQQPQQQQQQQQQYNYQAASISRPSANIAWNPSNSNSGHVQQQFSLVPSGVGSAVTTTAGNSSLATITRVNSNGCGTAAAASTTSAMYDSYNAQLKAHSLYQLNNHLANAAVMAMANKLNANRTSLSVPQLASSSVSNHMGSPNNSNADSGGASNSHNSHNHNNSYSGTANDRLKTQQQQQQQQQEFVIQTAKTNHANSSAAAVISSSSAASSNSSSAAAIPLIQFEAAKLQQQLQLQQQQLLLQQQQQQQAKVSMVQQHQQQQQQSSPISYSMWNNNSPMQNKFSCDVAQQQQQQSQQQNVCRPMHSPSTASSAFTRQQQQQKETNHQRTTTQQSQSLQDSFYTNQRLKANSSTESGQYQSTSEQSARGTSSPAAAAVVPRRPSPLTGMSQASPLGHTPSPAYPMYNSPMNMTSQQYSDNSSSSVATPTDTTYQTQSVGKSQETSRNNNNESSTSASNVGYSSVITRVAGSAWEPAWERPQQQQPQQQSAASNGTDSRINRAPKKRRPTKEEVTPESNSWQQQPVARQTPAKQPYESPLPLSSNSNSNSSPFNNHGALHTPHHHQQQQQQSSAFELVAACQRNFTQRTKGPTEEEEAAMEKRRAELARSQVVVPDIMEELNFLTAEGMKAAAAAKKASPPKPPNGRVKIISVEPAKAPTGDEKKAANAKKPEDKGFIGSYLKFLQGDSNQLNCVSSAGPRGRKVGGGVPSRAETAASKRKNNAAQQKQLEGQQQDEDKDAEPAKKARSGEVDDQGYVPNGGASAFEQNYHQQQQQHQYQQQYMHPLSVPGTHHAHYQGLNPMAGASAAVPQILPQAYPPATEADGFNYFDFQFRPRW